MTRYADAQLNAIKRALLATGEARKQPASTILTRYATERFLCRVGHVEPTNKREIVLRGGVLLGYWHLDEARPSLTLDLLTRRPMDDAALVAWLQKVCNTEDPDDGLVFQADSILLTDRRGAGGYRTRRAALSVLFGRQRTELHIDVAQQKDLLPHPQEETLANLLDLNMAPAKVWTCVKETVLAEKLHMVHVLGRQPSYKDIYDMFLLITLHPYPGGPTVAAIKTTFDQNVSTIGAQLPRALLPANGEDTLLNAGWGGFIRQMGTPLHAKPWPQTLLRLHDFFTPAWDHLVRQKPFASTWKPAEGWG